MGYSFIKFDEEKYLNVVDFMGNKLHTVSYFVIYEGVVEMIVPDPNAHFNSMWMCYSICTTSLLSLFTPSEKTALFDLIESNDVDNKYLGGQLLYTKYQSTYGDWLHEDYDVRKFTSFREYIELHHNKPH